jgi:hypothetical protein
MHLMLSRISFAIGLVICAPAANAATVFFNISDQAGFQQNGFTSPFGNGIVFLSPIYSVGFGDTVDFGTALLSPNFIDFRSGCNFTNNCFANYAYRISFLTDGIGGLTTAPFDLGSLAGSIASLESCPDLICPVVVIPLLFTLPSDADGIQFAFQGSAISIAPPIPEPSTWAMLLIGFAGIALVTYRRRKIADRERPEGIPRGYLPKRFCPGWARAPMWAPSSRG